MQGQELVAFERFMTFRKTGGNHCHINVLPIPAAAAPSARQVRCSPPNSCDILVVSRSKRRHIRPRCEFTQCMSIRRPAYHR